MEYVNNVFRGRKSSKKVFQNKDILRHYYTPENLPHRKKQIEDLASILVSALNGETPSNVFIYGKTGTGKTATVKFVADQLEKMSREMGVFCYAHFLNCQLIDTQYRVLAALAKSLGKNVPMTGWPTDQVFEKVKNSIDERKQTVVIILDEIDRLASKEDKTLYNLSRINTELENARVSLIGISNDLTFKNFLDARVLSSLGEEELVFPPYNADQLQDILSQRAELGLSPNVLGGEVIPLCAALAAQEHGDARKALDLLRVSGEIAENEGTEVIGEEHVKKAVTKIEADHVLEAVKQLPAQTKVLLFGMILLSEAGSKKFETGEIFKAYKSLCKELGINVLTQRRVSELISELDMLGIINSVVISKGRYGRTREIKLEAYSETMKKTILEDTRLERLSKLKRKIVNFDLNYFNHT